MLSSLPDLPHTCTVPLSETEANTDPSKLKASSLACPSLSFHRANLFPLGTCLSSITPSVDDDAMHVPSALSLAAATELSCPSRRTFLLLVLGSNSWMERSFSTRPIFAGAEVNDTWVAAVSRSVGVLNMLPVAKSQRATV